MGNTYVQTTKWPREAPRILDRSIWQGLVRLGRVGGASPCFEAACGEALKHFCLCGYHDLGEDVASG